MKIVLTGATGHLGGLVLRQLLYRVPASTLAVSIRNPESAPEWERQGIEARYGDYDVPDSLDAAFQGATNLLFVSSPHPDDAVRLRQHAAVVEAAKRSGVRRLVYTSIVRPERGRLPLHALHLQTERLIRESNIPYTILRNAYYMDIVKFLGVREAAASGELWSPPGDWTFNAAAREDLAAAAAEVLTEESHAGQTYELTASRVWNPDDLARAIAESAGRRVVHRTNPDMAHPIYRMLALADMRYTSKDLERLVGRPLRTMQDEVRAMFDPNVRP
ncbi:NAD(P)H-binding protein [Paenibacillus sacheonensis]|uniref:NAD(P)H-binding protein n=1 Tax=Paenibacillus sacheonensis TaxID=742054 RepID=A0A7X5BYS7_9BACL|nr:NAD(P)H-binding protein [Paenibacillus sacheonensis]MBM7569497.1 NAD(P)H dehydrogenase (quinone) [Paenibacillus sacheonensis]NBC71913.1 NAD(P)H-binding protein [Paenibacillus sacheonensis]